MKRKDGFTLIELLAIIVILAVIAVITVPIILGIVDNAKKNSVKDSAYGYKDAINKFYATKTLQDKNYTMENKSYTVAELETEGVTVSGQTPDSNSWVTIENNNVKTGCLQFGEYKVDITNGQIGEAVSGTCEIPLSPGLYDENDNLVVSYDYLVSEYGFDPSIDNNGESVIVDILSNYSNGVKLVLPNTVSNIGRGVFSESGLTSITIPSSVTSIGTAAFKSCENLTSVIFESGSNLMSIGGSAFYESGLTSITIPSSVTSIGNFAFEYSSSLTSVTFENGSQLTSIGYEAFCDTGLTSVTIPSSVTSIGEYAFRLNADLTNVIFEDGSQLTSIGDGIFSSTGLTSITIPSSVTSIGEDAFSGIGTVYYSGSATGSPWGATNVVSQ